MLIPHHLRKTMPSRKKYNYQPAKNFYIYGEWIDDEGCGMHKYPTLEEVQTRFPEISLASIKKTAADENWFALRREQEKTLNFKARKYAAELTKTSENLSEFGYLTSEILVERIRELKSKPKMGMQDTKMLKDLASVYQTIEATTKSLFRAKRDSAEQTNPQKKISPEEVQEKRQELLSMLKESEEMKELSDLNMHVAFDDPQYIAQYGKAKSREMIKKHPDRVMAAMVRYQPGGDRYHIYQQAQMVEVETFDNYDDESE